LKLLLKVKGSDFCVQGMGCSAVWYVPLCSQEIYSKILQVITLYINHIKDSANHFRKYLFIIEKNTWHMNEQIWFTTNFIIWLQADLKRKTCSHWP
jgi:hypothetical protein